MSSAIAFSSSSLFVSESSPSLHLERKAVGHVTILRIPRCTSVSQTVHQQEKNRVPEKSVNPTSSEDAKPKSNRRSMVKSSLAAAAAIGVSAAEKRQARAATAAATCQVSSSSLGIDFCDSVEGNGIIVEKGMVIKVSDRNLSSSSHLHLLAVTVLKSRKNDGCIGFCPRVQDTNFTVQTMIVLVAPAQIKVCYGAFLLRLEVLTPMAGHTLAPTTHGWLTGASISFALTVGLTALVHAGSLHREVDHRLGI